MPLQVDDVLAMNALFLNLYIPGGYAQVPAIVYQLSEGDYSALASTLPLYYANSGTARVMHMAIACSDDPIASLDEVNLDVPEMYKALILDDAESYATVCPMLGVPHMDDSSDALVESEIPALLLQGGLDPATPVSGGDNVATGLPNSYNIVVPAGSHIQSQQPVHPGHHGRLHARPAGRARHELHRPERALRRALCGDRHQRRTAAQRSP